MQKGPGISSNFNFFLRERFLNKTAKQTLALFSAQIVGMGIGFAINMLLSKRMGPEVFGLYVFAFSTITYIANFFDFGFFSTAGKVLAGIKEEKIEREYVGTILIIFFALSLLLALSVYAISFFIDSIFPDKIGPILSDVFFFSFIFILPFFMDLLLKGLNQIEVLASFHIGWKVFYLFSILILIKNDILSPEFVLLSYSFSGLVFFLGVLFLLKPKLSSLSSHIRTILKENKTYGTQMYSARIIDSATYDLNRFIMSYFVGASVVGFYSLATSLSNPLNALSSALSSSKFKSFSDGTPISKDVLKANLLWVIAGGLGSILLSYLVVHFYLGEQYHPVFPMQVILIFAVGFNALAQPYNAWLSSVGRSRLLRRKTIVTAVLNVVLYFSLIPLFGGVAAAFSSAVSMAVSYFLHLKYYKDSLKL